MSPVEGRPRELVLAWVLNLLQEQGLLTEEQIRLVKIRESTLRQRILLDKEVPGGRARYQVSPVEVVAAAELQGSDGRRLNEDRIMEVLAAKVGMPFMKIDPLKLDARLVTDTFSRAYARHNAVLPVGQDGGRIILAISDPFNVVLQESIKRTLQFAPDFVLSSKTDIQRIITEIYGFRSSVKAAADEHRSEVNLGNLEQYVSIKRVDEIEATDAHIVNAVDYLLHYAFGQRASDIHIEPRREFSVIRLRIDGVLHQVYQLPRVVHAPFVSRLKMMSRMDIAEKRRPQDGRIKTDDGGKEVELRVSTMPVAFGEKVVIRVFNPQNLLQDLPGLGLDGNELSLYSGFLAHRTGILLVTGPTGSGKTTTLYSSLRYLESNDVNITTIEDPVEMVYDSFNQVQVHNKIGLSFHSALRTVLRQDPDIVMVGEIRDEETAHMAVQAALTGHLVLSTLHTNDTASTVTRLLDLGVKPFLLSSTLVGVVAQRLMRRICTSCKQDAFLTEDQMIALELRFTGRQKRRLPIKVGVGCPTCRYTGLYGRSAVFEVMPVNENIRRLINERSDATELLRAARADGMLTLKEVAIRKLAQGETTFDEVMRVVGTT